jgi:hypothetical protein
MTSRKGLIVASVGLLLGVWLAGCGSLPAPLNTLLQSFTSVLNPDLLPSLGLGTQAASLPGNAAPGLLVSVENRTPRWVDMTVSYRTSGNQTNEFTTVVAPHDKSGQMLICPIDEITVGDVGNPKLSGARVFLIDNVTDSTALATAPFIEVDAFGQVLREGVNYDCGDGVTFAVQESSVSQSGYQVFAYIRRATQ